MYFSAKNANESKRSTSATISKLNTLMLTNQTSSNHLAECVSIQTNALAKELLDQHAANEKQIGENNVSLKQLGAESAEILKAVHALSKQQKERSNLHHHEINEMVY